MDKNNSFDDNDGLRQSIRFLLESEPDFLVIGDYGSALEIETILTQKDADVIVMDIDMPGINGIEAVRRVKEIRPLIDIIMLTVFEDTERLFASFCAGASGYLLKMHSLAKLPESIRDVMLGGAPMSPAVARKMIAHFQQVPQEKYGLSSREKEILQWLVKGYSYKMIAGSASISQETVKTHLKKVYKKLHVNCATEAVAKVLKERLV
ncbi:MAG: response regulator transcription factor [Saprospiraceae bacterium]|nr:response regulator transcription factor [Saprospiraceae bacterium]